MQADDCEILKTFNAFLTLLQHPNLGEQMTVENAMQAFNCAYFVEVAITNVQAKGMDSDLEKRLQEYRKLEGKSFSQTCSDLEKACDKLLERFLKDSHIPTEIVNEYLKVYTQYFGQDRLNVFLNRAISNSISTNMIVESLEELGVSLSHMEDDALIISWEMAIENGDQADVVRCINKMLNDGHISKLIYILTESCGNDAIKKLVIQSFISKVVENHSAICIAFGDIKKKSLLKLLQSDHDLCINFIDAIFYFGRNMQQVDGKWFSNYDFKYEHLCKIIKMLLNSPEVMHKLIYDRLSIAKTQPDSEIWSDVEKDILIL